jgi:hypothetical protein
MCGQDFAAKPLSLRVAFLLSRTQTSFPVTEDLTRKGVDCGVDSNAAIAELVVTVYTP